MNDGIKGDAAAKHFSALINPQMEVFSLFSSPASFLLPNMTCFAGLSY